MFINYIVYLDFSKAFVTASPKILIGKLSMPGMDEQTLRCTEHWLNGWAQRVVISRAKSGWRPVTGSVPQGSILGPALFNILINDLDGGVECTLSKFADDTKLIRVADTPEGRAAIQRDLDWLEKWANRHLMKFNKEKCKDLHLGNNNSTHQYMLEDTQLERVRSVLGCIRQNIFSRLREVILPLYSALVRPHLECCVQFWTPQYKRDMGILRESNAGTQG